MTDSDGFEESVHGLSRLVASSNPDLRAALGAVARLACTGLADCEAASITLVASDDRPVTAAFSGDVAEKLDQAQYDDLLGPCLESITTGRPVRRGEAEGSAEWPHYAEAAASAGINSSLSLPLRLDNQAIGSLNLYASGHNAFDETDEVLAMLFADHAAVVVANTGAYWTARSATDSLTDAMHNRSVIEQATGIVMVDEQCDAGVAFESLRHAALDDDIKLRELAAQIVERRAVS